MLRGADAELEAPVLKGMELDPTTSTTDEEISVLKAADGELDAVMAID